MDGVIREDQWLPADPDSDPQTGRICTLEQWKSLDDKRHSAVQIEPGEGPGDLLASLDDLALVAINFPVFTDGRGFSYARELRERGYSGELRAVGHFIRDQLTYLRRVGFNAFQMNDDSQLESAVASLEDFSEYYQSAIDQPLPLFRRR
tara:strand:- start:7844 stop:8290 length:447 start_codon:yes stop_codon:yes gene_type:complete